MKRTLVAVAVAAFAATSANALTVYQKDGTKLSINGSVRVMLNKQTDKRTDLQNDGSRIKFKFSQDIGEGLSGLAYMELRPTKEDSWKLKEVEGTLVDKDGKAILVDGKKQTTIVDVKVSKKSDGKNFGNGIHTNKLYVGLKAKGIGALTFGKQATAADSFKLADPTEQGWSSLDGAKLVGSSLETKEINGHTYQYKTEEESEVATSGKKVVNFKSDEWAGFGFQTSYLFSDNAAKSDFNSNTWQLLLSYNSSPEDKSGDKDLLDLYQVESSKDSASEPQLKYEANVLYSKKRIADDVNHEVWGLAGKVSYDDFSFAADYTHSKIKESDLKAKTWELAATYQATKDMDVYTTYTHSKNQDDVKTKVISLGSHYKLAKNVKTYVEYTTSKVGKADRENGYYAGLRVFF